MLTAEHLRKLLSYDPETGAFVWLLYQSNRVPAGTVAGHLRADGYRIIVVDGVSHAAHRLAWLHVHGEWPPNSLDHINGQRADNRIANLRIVTQSQNQANRGGNKNNSSGFRGVSLHRRKGKYQASVRVNYKLKFLGHFDTADEAAAAARLARLETFGSYASDARQAETIPSHRTEEAFSTQAVEQGA